MGKEDPTLPESSSSSKKKKYPVPNYARRREQVRRAQKKHRDEKEKRCGMLEDELHQLYGLITNKEQLHELYHENQILRDIVSRHSISLPPSLVQSESALARVTIIGDSSADQYLQVQLPNEVNQLSCPPYETPITATQSYQPPPDEEREYPDSKAEAFGFDQERAQLGIDFVLSLERPCLFHTRPLRTEEPSGHAMSMQGLLLSDAPSDLNNLDSWDVPARQLSKLFELSGFLGLEGEITPVQAWNRICYRFDVRKLPEGKLDSFRSAISPHINCYGFGARMDEKVFEDLLSEILG